MTQPEAAGVASFGATQGPISAVELWRQVSTSDMLRAPHGARLGIGLRHPGLLRLALLRQRGARLTARAAACLSMRRHAPRLTAHANSTSASKPTLPCLLAGLLECLLACHLALQRQCRSRPV